MPKSPTFNCSLVFMVRLSKTAESRQEYSLLIQATSGFRLMPRILRCEMDELAACPHGPRQKLQQRRNERERRASSPHSECDRSGRLFPMAKCACAHDPELTTGSS